MWRRGRDEREGGESAMRVGGERKGGGGRGGRGERQRQ